MKARVEAWWLLLWALGMSSIAHAQTYTKTETIEYHDDLSLWVLGQVKRTTTNGIESSRTEYAWKASPTKTYAFGKLQQTIGYNTSNGTVSHVVDGKNNLTIFRSWMRGIPQQIEYADGYSQYATVNDSGWITSITDENGYKTCYGYDTMGRLSSITYPSETAAGVCDTSKWTATTFTWEYRNLVEHGLPAGHWLRRNHTGNHRRNTFYDALWRPVLEHYYDGANVDATLQTRAWSYDTEGRVTFASYPVGTTTGGTTGTWTEYDALGRVTSVSQDSEQGLLTTTTAYLAGLQTRVTTPKGLQTTTAYQAYDQPTYDWPRIIIHPEGTYTHITRDVFGKPTALRRSNSSSATGGTGVNRSYTYNSYQELCRSVEPETGATLMGYDGAGNLAWSATGLPAATACDATGTSAAVVARKASRTYDTRNRVKSLTFPDGKGDQAWTYTPDGLPASIAVTNPNVSTPITNTYSYNRRRLLASEATKISTPTYTLSYGYNAYGHLSSVTYPNTTVVGLAPNGLGQPTQAGSYATGAQYYPNGALKQFTYGNGIVHTMTQNARQLPARSTDSNGTLDLGYAYDKQANVSSITDYTSGARQSRSMTYDNLERLTQATGASFGTASYTYDVLDNLKTLNVTGGNHVRNYGYVYDSSNRLTNLTNGVGGASIIGLGYDPQGNVVNKNGQTYEFDYGNRLRRATNKEWYAYDGHGRRVLSCTPTACDYQQYAADGKLYFHQDNRNGLNYVNVYLGGSLVAIREQPTAGGSATIKYQHTDALGTPIAETDANKTILRKSEYEPYGLLTNRTLTDGPGFTGHVQDAATGLAYMQQRYYDPLLGRFLSVDPVGALSNPVGYFHRYKYANNSPYKFTDPDGRGWFDEFLPPNLEGRTNPYAPIDGASRGDVAFLKVASAGPIIGVSAALCGPGCATRSAQRIVEETITEISIPAGRYPESATHIKDAQEAGQPSVLTVNRQGAAANRREALRGTPTRANKDRDEYPPAMFKEGGEGSSVRHIGPSDNRGSGACIGAQCRGLPDGAKVRIKVEDAIK
ncbi:RHS repeat-associated core domain-containing protein [Pseudoxanthomonas wuyuanensis]|uniref:RHS repeat-associated core domain-containing protein n=1 Tax=Pseudoxanthomonas wuyuanensis TaxID=1073196 RepID=A0A286CVQ6_9GAMM|nr:RHS repeat-associated core domain-containing protein [Pseudoxanthomonas wuyuanensis]SOD50479.1 RHS repeat-associated core domain-containing protein [Pseudoxanthomonas wuyuanensis]